MSLRIRIIIAALFPVMLPGILAQNHTLSGFLENAEGKTVFLGSYQGSGTNISDSIRSSDGSFYFILDEERRSGFFRITVDKTLMNSQDPIHFREFIFHAENLEFYGDIHRMDQLVIPNSVENEILDLFQDYEKEYQEEVSRCYPLLSRGDLEAGNSDIQEAEEDYEELQTNRGQFIDSISDEYPDLFVTRYIHAFRAPFLPGHMSHKAHLDTLKLSFFNEAPIDDPALLAAPVYPFKINDYMSLYLSDQYSGEEQELQLIEAVDNLMVNVSHEPELRVFVVEYMLKGFERSGMEKVQVHLADHYLDESCESDIVELVLSRMDGYRKMKKGNTVPDFIIRDIEGKNHQLTRLRNPYVVVMFWASTCDHCQQMVPRLHEWYLHENRIDLEFITISIDTTLKQFDAFIKELKPEWITTHDPLGWNGIVPEKYFIYATPSLFLLDHDRKIIARPFTYREYLRAIKRLN